MKAPARMKRLTLSLAAGLLFCGGLPAAEAPRWTRGSLSARVIEAGYQRDAKTGAWEASATLRFANLSAGRRYHQSVQVQFVDAGGKVLGGWKTFLSLPPGQAQHRQVRAPGRLACAGELPACPGLSLRVLLGPQAGAAAAVPIPAVPLADGEAPPEGQPLYVAQVYDGDTLALLSGQKIRFLGIDAPERLRKGGPGAEPYYQQATDFVRARVMDAPVTLAYDGEKRDVYGRWLARVLLEDGSDLNRELLSQGLARVYPRSDFSLKEDYLKAEAEARAAGRGLWGPAKP
jgi:micrococcal nuclease